AQLDLSQVDAHISPTTQDHTLGSLTPALARAAPHALAVLTRRLLAEAPDLPAAGRYWRTLRMTDQILLADDDAPRLARRLRDAAIDGDPTGVALAKTRLLLLEIFDLPPAGQIAAVMAAELP